jgi:hypothetical protein
MENPLYVGNGAYCYANSTSMLLASIGEKISPSLIEVLTGVSMGASLKKENGILYFNNQCLLPDLGITKALDILGFQYKTKVFEEKDSLPTDELKNDLVNGPTVLGPLDMGFLDYNPNYKYLSGADHYVLVYKIDNEKVYLHDPAGFPFVFLSFDQLNKAWRAEKISYHQGAYRYTSAPKRTSSPSDEEIYKQATEFFKSIYKRGEEADIREKWFVGKEAIDTAAGKIRNEGLGEKEINHFVNFVLPLGAKRALDFAAFFEPYSPDLSQLKQKQAVLFGQSQALAMKKDWPALSQTLKLLAEVEEEFRTSLLVSVA